MYKTIAIIVAAGLGTRLSNAIPKQYIEILGKTIIRRSIESIINIQKIDAVIVAINRDHKDLYKKSVCDIEQNLLPYVFGGERRQDTVRIALEEIKKYNPKNVLIHDAARIFVNESKVIKLIDYIEKKNINAAICACPANDSLKYSSDKKTISKSINREGVFLSQTPQAFDFQQVLYLHNIYSHLNFTDDSQMFEHHGEDVHIVQSQLSNFKITTKEDLAMAEKIITQGDRRDFNQRQKTTVIGCGFDAHKFKPSEFSKIKLCGVDVECSYEIVAHSDGDVVLHALTDAFLGSIGMGDIGEHFPPSENEWKDADSSEFVLFARNAIYKKDGVINNIDITIISETPKISCYRDKFKKSIASMLEINDERVNIKATTTEGMGFTGRKEGIACNVVVSVCI